MVDLNKMANQIRRDSLRMIHAVNSGHPGAALGCADLFSCLYFSILKHHPENFSMKGENEVLFFLSNGHLSAAWYSTLARAGYFPINELATFRKIGSRLQGHPTTAEHLPGIRIASGSLGQGMSNAIGAAVAKKQNNDTCLVYSLHGDGELQEGQIWEAAMYAAAKKVDNLISIVDYNGQQIDGPVNEVLSLGNLKAKFEAFGWRVFEMNGNDCDEVVNMLTIAKQSTGKGQPIMILMKTQMGNGVDFMMGSHKWHGVAPNDEQLKNALEQLSDCYEDF